MELFAGCHSICNGVRRLGLSAVSLDFSTVSYYDDINSTTGFLRALTYVIGLLPMGLLWLAPPCSSWVFMSRGSTHRTHESPLGNLAFEKVRAANMQVSRVVLLVLMAMLLHNAIWLGEQPLSSLLPLHHRWQMLQEVLGERFHELHMWMSSYGAGSPKPSLLMSNHADIVALWKPRPHVRSTVKTTRTYVDASGQTRVTGSDELKGTQAYPPQFGEKVGRVYSSIMSEHPCGDGVPLNEIHNVACHDTDCWDDANLEEVLVDLQNLADMMARQ